MGLIFDQRTARAYESWAQSSQGRIIDKAIEHILIELLDPRPGERVLDIGCGSGNHLLILSRLGLDVCGLDASPLMIHKARERLGPKCTLKSGRAEDLPFDDNEFDFVVLINTLEFLDDPLQALREAGRVSCRKVFIGLMNSLSWDGLMKRIQGFLGNPLFNQTRFYNLWQLKSLLQKAFGPVPISWRSIDTCPSFLPNMAPFMTELLPWKKIPFANFLGISATILYTLKTDNLPLRLRLEKASRSVIGGRTLEDLKPHQRLSSIAEKPSASMQEGKKEEAK